MVDTEDIRYVDSLVQEYLLFRGFTNSIKSLEAEKKGDKLRGFQVHKIIASLFGMVHSGNIFAVRELWNHLNDMFFSRLEEDLTTTVQKLDLSLKRYYVVYSIQSGHVDRALEFFRVCAPELASDRHWKSWFVLPYLKSPETDPNFSIFFGKAWVETFSLSLNNFLSTIFQAVPLPKILNFNIERKLRISLQNLNDNLMKENESLRSRLEKMRFEVEKLNKSLTSANATISQLQTQINHLSGATPVSYSTQAGTNQSNLNATQTNQLNLSAGGHRRTLGPQTPIHQYQSTASSSRSDSPTSNNMTPSPLTYNSQTTSASSIPQAVRDGTERKSSNPITNLFSFNPKTANSTEPRDTNNLNQILASNYGQEMQFIKPTLESRSSTSSIFEDEVTNPALLTATKFETFATNSPLNCCKYSPDGMYIACGTQTGVTRIWPLGSQNSNRSATIYGNSEIFALEWEKKTGKLVLLGSGDGRVKVWNVAADKTVGDVSLSPYSKVKDIVCSPSGDTFACSASGSKESKTGSSIYLLNAKTLQLSNKIELNTAINSFAYNHNGTMIVAGGNDGHIRIFDMSTRSAIMSWKAHVGAVLNVTYSYDETSVYSIGADGKLLRWSVHNAGKLTKQYIYNGSVDGARRVDLAFDESQNYFVVPTKTELAAIYHQGMSAPLVGVGRHQAAVTCCDWHPHQNQIMTGCLDGVVCLSTLVSES